MENGKKVKAVSCTNDRIDPTNYEFSNGIGKELSCFCGGDSNTEEICARIPGLNMKLKINPPKNDEAIEFTMDVLQRAGTPSQVKRTSTRTNCLVLISVFVLLVLVIL